MLPKTKMPLSSFRLIFQKRKRLEILAKQEDKKNSYLSCLLDPGKSRKRRKEMITHTERHWLQMHSRAPFNQTTKPALLPKLQIHM